MNIGDEYIIDNEPWYVVDIYTEEVLISNEGLLKRVSKEELERCKDEN